MKKSVYEITISSSTTYTIKASCEEEAIEAAADYFIERDPDVSIKELSEDSEYDYEVDNEDEDNEDDDEY